MVGIAQLVRAPDCGSGGRGFEFHYSPQKIIQTNMFELFFFCIYETFSIKYCLSTREINL